MRWARSLLAGMNRIVEGDGDREGQPGWMGHAKVWHLTELKVWH